MRAARMLATRRISLQDGGMYGIESLLTGRTLVDRYRIEEVIGRGGMGAVYRASDERLGRRVAVKVITVAAPGPEAHARLRARFQREARAAARLHHPNVVAVYDFGTDPDLELDFLVMELLHGEDLAARLARLGPPPFPESLQILAQAARGLGSGHRAGLIHRDVKPGNLYLEEGDGGADLRVRILDFGIAEITADDETVTQLTAFGRSPFSPAYASPEQLRGDSRLTPATDVFSLGAVGYHLLTGYRAFTSPDLQRMEAELSSSLAALRTRTPFLSPVTRQVLEKALAHAPDDRYPDADALARALQPAVRAHGQATAPADAVRVAPAAPTEERGRRSTRLFGRAARRDPTVYEPTATRPLDELSTESFGPLPRRSTGQAVEPWYPAERLAPVDGDGSPGLLRQMCSAVWNFFVTCVVVGAYIGTWALTISGLWGNEPGMLYGGVAGSIVLAPLLVHRIMGRRGSFRAALIGSIAASVAAVFFVGPDANPDRLLAAILGLQVAASIVTERFTRRPLPSSPEPKHTPMGV